jgi:hypothetical protein
MNVIPNKSDLFDQVETFFNDKIYSNTPARAIQHVNICCEEEEKDFLMDMAKHLSEEFPDMSMKDVYIALIFSYYALTLGEQSTDCLHTRTFAKYADDYDGVLQLYLQITVGDINRTVLDPTENESEMETYRDVNLSSQIRRHMFGMPYGGLRTKKKRRGKRKNEKRAKKSKNSNKKVF